VGGWVDGWMEVKAILSIAYSNQKLFRLGNLFEYQFVIQIVQPFQSWILLGDFRYFDLSYWDIHHIT
jgi:hypothetical protein